MKDLFLKLQLLLLLLILAFSSCTPSRSMLNSGKVLPKNQVRFGENYTFNISSAPIAQSIKGSVALSNDLSQSDTIYYDEQIKHINSALIAYCLDPIGSTNDFYFRYGLGHHLDLGYKNSGGANAFDIQYQFLGSNKTFNESEYKGMYGSIGAQYAWQNYRFLKIYKFDKMQQLFGLEMSRQEISVPVIFSKPFGPEERVGCLSFGVVYSHSFIKYKLEPKKIYELDPSANISPELLAPVDAKRNFSTYGTFINLKIGKKFIFFNVSLAAYYQNYGSYPLLGGEKVNLQGVSIVPSYGIQFNILPKKKKEGNF